jgi:transposase
MSTSTSTGVSKPRRVHTKEFKQGALRLAEQIGVSRASTDLGIDSSQLYEWRKQARSAGADAFRGQGRQTEAEAELTRLHREIAVLKMEREILRKAAEFWVRESR